MLICISYTQTSKIQKKAILTVCSGVLLLINLAVDDPILEMIATVRCIRSTKS